VLKLRLVHPLSIYFFEYLGDLNITTYPLITYIDTDLNPATGYSANLGKIGADYMLQSNVLYKHQGNSLNWDWTQISTPSVLQLMVGITDPTRLEIGISRSVLNITGSQFSFFIISIYTNSTIGTQDWADDVYDYHPPLGNFVKA